MGCLLLVGAVLCFTVWCRLMPFSLNVRPHLSYLTVLSIFAIGSASGLFASWSLFGFLSLVFFDGLDFH